MLRASLLASVLCASAWPALAAGTISCASPEGDAEVELTVGSLPVLVVVGATVGAGDRVFAMAGESGTEAIVVGQAFRDHDRLMVDFTDPNIETVLLRLRLIEASEERGSATAGTLAVAGLGAWALTCTGS